MHALAPAAAEYVPASQAMHALAPAAAEYVPASQSVQTEAAADENLPAPQAQQPWASAQPLPPVEALPTASLKVPAGQAWQVCWLTATSCNSLRMMPVFPPPLLVSLESRKPTLQRQELAAVPVAGCEFAGQAMHALAPAAAEYVPGAQSVQVASLVCPVNAEYVPAAQAKQAAELVCPVNAEYVPAAQEVQAAELVCAVNAENLPAAQSSQDDAPANFLMVTPHFNSHATGH
jgi:hypothetical protein